MIIFSDSGSFDEQVYSFMYSKNRHIDFKNLRHGERQTNKNPNKLDKMQGKVGPRVLIIDNYDSYTFNLYQYFTAANNSAPVVITNNQFSWGFIKDRIIPFFDSIVISPGPGRPDFKENFGVCWNVLKECEKPILGICLGHQGLAAAYGGKVFLINKGRQSWCTYAW